MTTAKTTITVGGVFLHLSTTFDLPISFITFPYVSGKYKTPVGEQDTGESSSRVMDRAEF